MFERTCRFIESPIQIEYVCQSKTKLDKSKNPKDKDNGSKMEKIPIYILNLVSFH
jgi:hypothetical protein